VEASESVSESARKTETLEERGAAERLRRAVLPVLSGLALALAGAAWLVLAGSAEAGGDGKSAPVGTRGPVVTWQSGGTEQKAWVALDSAAIVDGDAADGVTLRVQRLWTQAGGLAALGPRLGRLQARVNGAGREGGPLVGAVLYQGTRRRENRLVTVGDVVVRFRAGVNKAERDALAGKLALRQLDGFSFSENTYLYRAAAPLDVFAARDALDDSKLVEWATPSFLRFRAKRALPDDPLFPSQWHLRNIGQHGGRAGQDINVASVWEETVAGVPLRGSCTAGFGDDDQVIAIADDGLETAHPDLAANIVAGRSYDWADGDTDPSPSRAAEDQQRHGTACAGVAAARGYNGFGVTGVAPSAGLVGYRFLIDGVDSDVSEAQALAALFPDPLNREVVDICSCSWGPTDDRHLEAPGPLTQAALLDGVTNGRGGKGIVYVWAAGNGRAEDDNVNYDGYANSRYTLAVGASTATGRIASYSEDGAPLRVVAPSSGGGADTSRDITTTDQTGPAGYASGDYCSAFGGTSAAAPMVSGVVALMLQANPQLTWRDVQVILCTTARKINPGHDDWTTNAAGHHINHTYGFGLVDTAAAVAAAQTWQPLGAETTLEASATPNSAIPDASAAGVTSSITLGAERPRLPLEYVDGIINAPHTFWHDLEVTLIAPSGTESILSTVASPSGSAGAGLEGWRFGSARHLGESSCGTWRLRVRDLQRGDTGRLVKWTLRLYGTQAGPDSEAPVTSVVPAKHWWNGTVSLGLRAVDVGSNVASTEWRIGRGPGGQFRTATKVNLRVTKRAHVDDGRRTLWFRSTDNLGNAEVAREFVLNIDTRRPRTRVLGNAVVRKGGVAVLHGLARDPGFSAHRVRLRFQILSAGGRVVRTVDAGRVHTGQQVTERFRCKLPRGTYSVRALATDLAGNAQSRAGLATLTVR